MEKTNLSKRVVAGTLALLTVFGSAPASLQGVFAPSTLVAEAANQTYSMSFAGAEGYIKSIKVGSNSEITADMLKLLGAKSSTVTEGDTIVIKSSVPLDIQKYSLAAIGTTDQSGAVVYKWLLKDGVTEAPDKWHAPEAASAGKYKAEYDKEADLDADIAAVVTAINAYYGAGDTPTSGVIGDLLAQKKTADDAIKTASGVLYGTKTNNSTHEMTVGNAESPIYDDVAGYSITKSQLREKEVLEQEITTQTNAVNNATTAYTKYSEESTRANSYTPVEGDAWNDTTVQQDVGGSVETVTVKGIKSKAIDERKFTASIVAEYEADTNEAYSTYTQTKSYSNYTAWLDAKATAASTTKTAAQNALKKAQQDLYLGTNNDEEGSQSLDDPIVYTMDDPAPGTVQKAIKDANATIASNSAESARLAGEIETAKTNRNAAIEAENAKKNSYEGNKHDDGWTALGTADSYKETTGTDEFTYEFKAPEKTATSQPMDHYIEVKAKSQQFKVEFVKKNESGAFVAATTGDEAKLANVSVDYSYVAGKLEHYSVAQKENDQLATNGNGAKEPIVGSEVKIKSADAFAITVFNNDEKSGYSKPATTFDAENQQFVTTFKMPASADGSAVKFYAEKVTENFTYTKDGTKLVAKTDTGSINNAEAASFRVFYKEPVVDDQGVKTYKKDDADKSKDKETVIAPGDVVPNGMEVFYEFNNGGDKLTKGAAAQIKKGDTFVVGTAAADETVATKLTNTAETTGIKNPGSYTVKLTVTGKDDAKYELTQAFSIANPDQITADKVNLILTYNYKTKEGEVKQNQTMTKTGVVNGTADFVLDSDRTPDGKFTVSVASVGGRTLDAVDLDKKITYSIDGYVSGSTVGEDYSFVISVKDDVLGTYDIPIKWKVSAYVSPVSFKNQDDAAGVQNRLKLSVADDKMDTLGDLIYDMITDGQPTKAAKEEVTYEYVEGEGALVSEDELDERKSGLPKTGKVGEKFTVYAIYNGEAKVSVLVTVEKKAHLKIDVDDSILAMTFGDEIDTSKYTLTNTDTKKAVTDVQAKLKYTISPADLKDGKVQTDDKGNYIVKKADGVAVDANTLKLGGKYYPAGTYIVKFENDNAANPVDGYDFEASDEKVLVISKKAIAADMITISPIEFNGAEHDIVSEYERGNTVLSAVDAATGLDLTEGLYISEGPKKTAVGRYDAKVSIKSQTTVDEMNDNKDSAQTVLDNYQGDAKANWSIVNKKVANNFVDWNNDKTTMYDNGRIHFQIDRVHDDSLIVGNVKKTVKEFGVIIEKNGKFAAPEVYAAPTQTEIDAVNNELQLGNGYTTGKYVAGASDAKVDALKTQNYLVNIKVKDVDTGIWARPYILLDDGTVSYGTTKYINLKNWATEELNLQIAKTDKVEKAVRMAELSGNDAKFEKVRSGYVPSKNKFYAYAEFTELDKTKNAKSLTVSDFGVVLDKTGTVKQDDAKTKLVLGNGFIEGHYNPNNAKLGTNQYAATVTPKDSVTGVWVRGYVDLGNNLVVYTDPIYINNASNYYSESKPEIKNVSVAVESTGKIKIDVQGKAAPDKDLAGVSSNDKIKAVQAGVVLDKSGVTTYNDASTKLLLDSSFTEGKKTSGLTNGWTYSAKITPTEGKKLVVRPYAIYDIDGVKVTVYGDVVEWDPVSKSIVNPAKN